MAVHSKTPQGSLTARAAVASLGFLLVVAPLATAQSSPSTPPSRELRFTGGAYIPTGSQRTFLQNAQASAMQLSLLVRPSLAVTGTFSWARSRDTKSANADKLDVFMSDVGVEARLAHRQVHRSVTFSPFIGLGAGLRSYNYRKLDVDATHNSAGYAAVGGELGVGHVGIRLEARNYASGFKPLAGTGKSEMRNDVNVMLGLRFNRQQPSPK